MEENILSSSKLLNLNDLHNDSISSTATTICLDPLDSTHPSWSVHIRDAAKALTLPVIASLDFNWSKFEDLLTSRLLSTSFHYSAAETLTALNSIFRACKKSASVTFLPPSSPDNSNDTRSLSDLASSESSDDRGHQGSIVLNPQCGAHRNMVRGKLRSNDLDDSMRASLETFLATPKTSSPTLAVTDLTSLTSTNSAASSILQLLSPIEQSRPSLTKFTPTDIHAFLSKYEDYHRFRGSFSMALCLKVAEFNAIYYPELPPDHPTDTDVRERLLRLLPVSHAQITEYFHSKIAMRFPKKLRHLDQYDISRYEDSDVWNYYDRFLKFLDDHKIYWSQMKPTSAFRKQQNLFISGAKPPAFQYILEDRKDDMETLEHIRLSILDASGFAQNSRLIIRHRPHKSKPKRGSSHPLKNPSATQNAAGMSPNVPSGPHHHPHHAHSGQRHSGGNANKSVRSVTTSSTSDESISSL
jgi:hypothetical protein